MVWWTLHDVLLVHHTMAILETTIIDWQQHIQSPIYGDAKKSIQLLSLVDHVAYTLAFSKHSMQSFVVCYKYHGISRVFQKNLLHMLQCLQKVHVVVVVVWNGYVVCILTKLHTFVFFITKRSIVIWFDDYATFNKKNGQLSMLFLWRCKIIFVFILYLLWYQIVTHLYIQAH